MKYTNENGYYDNSCREYFILKAIFFYDSLLELEKEGLVSIIKPSETDKNTNPLLEAINNLAMNMVACGDDSELPGILWF